MVAEEERTSRVGEKEDEEYHKEDEDENEEWRKGARTRQANHTKISQYKKERNQEYHEEALRCPTGQHRRMAILIIIVTTLCH